MTVRIQTGYEGVVKPAVIGCLMSCAVMGSLGPADLVDNGGVRGEISYEPLVRHPSSLLSFTLIYLVHGFPLVLSARIVFYTEMSLVIVYLC